ncbi:MAG: bifunctional tetrahydrofolate synthase/dihydrofolate synthase [Methylococcaceae bacterium]
MARFDSLTDWLEWQEGFHPRSIDLGLERAAGVFKMLNPDAIKPATIIIAGTNGKGSCVAFLEAIYRAQGYRVGAYTSPHILQYNERIRIDGQPVADDIICQAFERIDAVRNNVSLSYFEFGTLAALDVFWRSDLDIQLLEVGLGGRLDAVNIIDSDVSLITSICIDHVDWLGETRDAIGYEKAGIFRAGVSAVIGDIDPPDSLIQAAIEKNSCLFRIKQEFDFQINRHGWDWVSKTEKQFEYLSLPVPALKGEHQYGNAASVLMVVEEMQSLLPVREESIHLGLQNVQLSGRFQFIDDGTPVLLDVAHNPQAVRALLDYLMSDFPGRRIQAVFSMMRDKDIIGVIEIINPVINHWFIAPLSNPRAASASFMQDCFKHCKLNNVTLGYKDFEESYSAAEQQAEEGDLILIFGSFFLVSEYLAKVGNI